MSDVHGGTIHYRCAFDATCVNSDWADPYPDLSKRLRTWVEDTLAVPRNALKNKKFLIGGTFKEECPPKTYFETISRNYNTEGLAPTYWGCRISHPCPEFFYRRWTHECTVTSSTSNSFRIVVASRHSISGYLGEEPETPAPFVPGIKKSLLTSRHRRCSSGSEMLSDRPGEIPTGFLHKVKESILSTSRTCPIVYASIAQDTGLPLVDVDLMAGLLCGAARVFVADSSNADAEMEKLLGDFSTWNGGIRVYQPSVNLGSEADKKRHRFFSPYDVRKYGTNEVIMQIVRACCRRAPVFAPNDVISIESIVSTARRRRLHELIRSQANGTDSELVELAEDLDKQVMELQQENKRLSEEVDTVRLESEIQLDESKKHQARTKYELDAQKEALPALYQRMRELEAKTEVVESLKKLPSNLPEMLKLICTLHSDKLDCIPDAMESARTAKFNDLQKAWELMWSLAEVLHPMLFGNSIPFSSVEFKNKTGFNVAMSEGNMTQRDAKLMRLREREYQGRKIDITAHVGVAKPPAWLRIHFAVDHASGKLVIGHCGDHMENYSTQKLS